MWFLWSLITFLIVIFSTAQIIAYIICFLRYPELMEGMPARNRNTIVFGLVLHTIINVAWVIVVCCVTSVREHWIAIMVTAAIALFFSISGIRNDSSLYSTFKRLTGKCDDEIDDYMQTVNARLERLKRINDAQTAKVNHVDEENSLVEEDSSKSQKIKDVDE